jgi:F420-non-reducing hydrogenase iron-sulfur subunit
MGRKAPFFCEKGVPKPDEKGYQLGMTTQRRPVLALFYCQNTPESGKDEQQALEKKYGESLRLFPIPCSGRLEPLHLLKALEDFADAGYVITCPEGACRYFEGNMRAKKRVERTRAMIKSIGLEEERVGLLAGNKENPASLNALAGEIMDRLGNLPPSPVLSPQTQNGGRQSGQTDKGDEE